MKEKTSPMGIVNSAFLLERLGQDCHPLQHLREYTQNAIEGILRTNSKAGEIVWDYDPVSLKKGLHKLSITDNGAGMTAEEMVKYLNHLSSSSAIQSLSENYGLGAKISAASKNPNGVVYRSWRHGKGFEVVLWKDVETNQYGIKKSKDGSLYSKLPLNKKIAHGTSVVFLGKDHKDNTVDFVGEHGGTLKFKVKYLNDRYWKFPKGITVKVREYEPKDKHSQLREVQGQHHFLEQYKLASGKMALENATAYWWITNDVHFRAVHDYAAAQGFVATLYKNELYDMPSYNRSRISRLQEFGVAFGHKNVFIIIEPHMKNLTTDTARTFLKVGKNSMPWSSWAEEFRRNIPDEILKFVEAQYDSARTTEAEINRLMEIEALFAKTSRYVVSQLGTITEKPLPKIRGPREETKPGEKVEFETTGTKKKKKKDQTPPKPKGSEEVSDKGKLRLIWPQVRWVDPSEDEAISDRAAKYIPVLHEIHANKNFRLFKDMEKTVLDIYHKNGRAILPQAVSDKVYEWYGQFLKEIVMSVKALKWDEDATRSALSEEALTAGISMKYAILQCIEKDLGKKLVSKIAKEEKVKGRAQSKKKQDGQADAESLM